MTERPLLLTIALIGGCGAVSALSVAYLAAAGLPVPPALSALAAAALGSLTTFLAVRTIECRNVNGKGPPCPPPLP